MVVTCTDTRLPIAAFPVWRGFRPSYRNKFQIIRKKIWLIVNNVATFAIPNGGYRSAERPVCTKDR